MKRAYSSDARDVGASKTRFRILESARQLFQDQGFDSVTISQIAKSAHVSMPTIYALFKSKSGVLQALFDEALPPEQLTSLVEGATLDAFPKKRLEMTAKLTRQMYDAEKGVIDLLRGASIVDPVIKKLEEEREKRRYDRQGESVKNLEKEGFLAKGLSLEKARDILWVFTGRDMYRMFVVVRGWSSDEYEVWLANTLITALLPRQVSNKLPD